MRLRLGSAERVVLSRYSGQTDIVIGSAIANRNRREIEGLNACECSYPSLLAEKRGRLAHEWTNQIITSENRNYLSKLPEIFKLDHLCFATEPKIEYSNICIRFRIFL